MAKEKSTPNNQIPSPNTGEEFVLLKTDANGTVFMRKSTSGMREWKIEKMVGDKKVTTIYEQTDTHVRKFLRRGDLFDLDQLDAFRVEKLAVDKQFPFVVKKES